MSVTSFFERLTGRLEKKKKADASSLSTLITSIADGAEPNADEVISLLESTGKTPKDLQDAVNRVLNRRKWRAQLDAIPNLQAEKTKNDQTLQSLVEKRDKAITVAKADCTAACSPLLDRQIVIDRQLLEGETARQLLFDSSDRTAVQSAADEVREKIKELLKTDINIYVDDSRLVQPVYWRPTMTLAKRYGVDLDVNELEMDLTAKYQAKLAAHQCEIKKLEGEVARIELQHLEV
jgi:hypothetical protein